MRGLRNQYVVEVTSIQKLDFHYVLKSLAFKNPACKIFPYKNSAQKVIHAYMFLGFSCKILLIFLYLAVLE